MCAPDDTHSRALFDLESLGVGALRMGDVRARRELLAACLVMPREIRPSSRELAALTHSDDSTIRRDWRRDDVRQRAGAIALGGLRAVLLAAARAGVLVIAQRAAAGDAEAVAFLLDRPVSTRIEHSGALDMGASLLDAGAPRLDAGEGAAGGVLMGEADVEALDAALKAHGLAGLGAHTRTPSGCVAQAEGRSVDAQDDIRSSADDAG